MFYVYSDGGCYNWYVTDSYGRNSPYTYPNYEYGFVVHLTGDVGNSYDSPVGFGSCGNIYSKKIFSFRSPNVSYGDGYRAYFVDPDGDVVSFNGWYVINSCGLDKLF